MFKTKDVTFGYISPGVGTRVGAEVSLYSYMAVDYTRAECHQHMALYAQLWGLVLTHTHTRTDTHPPSTRLYPTVGSPCGLTTPHL